MGPWNYYESIREESAPAWWKTECANLHNQEEYRGFSFVNSKYGIGQCQTRTC